MRLSEFYQTHRGEQCRRRGLELARAVERMSGQAREIFCRHVLQPYLSTAELPTPEVYNAWFEIDYVRQPVSIREFVLAPNYLGDSLADKLSPRWLEDLEELYAGDYEEVVLAGGIGIGKTTIAATILAYDIYLISCLRDPAAAYGIAKDTPLTFLCVSVDLQQARNALFAMLFNFIRNSLYFQQVFPFDPHCTNEIRFRRHRKGPVVARCRAVAATPQAQLGVAVYSAALDEINFMNRVERSKRARPGSDGWFDQAQEIFNTHSLRRKSRLDQRGRVPGHLIAISSARYDQDFTELKARESLENPRIFFRRYAPWEVKPATNFTCNEDGSLKTFPIDIGDVSRRPRILAGTENDLDPFRVFEIPVDYLPEFERNLETSIQNILGRSVLATAPFITKRESIARMFEMGEVAGLEHAFTKVDDERLPLDVTLQGAAAEYEHILWEKFHWIPRGTFTAEEPWSAQARLSGPIDPSTHWIIPEYHFAHVDLSATRDATGVVIGHVVGWKEVPRANHDGKAITERLPVIRIDLVLRIVPPPNGEIDPAAIRAIFLELRDKYRMEFGLITYDHFASQESLKKLKDNFFTCEEFSVDEDFIAYSALKQALADERVICYRHPKLESELVHLERTPKKVDHPSTPGSSKDLADCLAAVVHHCEVNFAKRGRNGVVKF